MAPKTLSAEARRLWAALHDRYEFGPGEDAVLLRALQSMDTADRAAAILRSEGLTVTSRFGEQLQHPLVPVARDSRAAFERGMKLLGLAGEGHAQAAVDPHKPGPKPKLRSLA
jgi:hypothetical protein